MWFPEGLDDPNVALIKVNLHQAEYWEATGGLITNTLSFAKSILSGQPPEDIGNHGLVKKSEL